MIKVLTSIVGVPERQIRQLRDDSSDATLLPTRANLIREFQNLLCDVTSGDELFFHFSGHTREMPGLGRGIRDGISPCDFERAGKISSENLHQLLVAPLPPGVRLIMVLDGGAMVDVPFRFTLQGDDRTAKVIRASTAPTNKGEVIAISEFQDQQMGNDFVAESMGSRKINGSLTQAFTTCLTENISYHKLLQRMRRALRKQGYLQVPQISSGQFLKLDEPIVTNRKDRTDSRPNSSSLGLGGAGQSAKSDCLIDMELAQMEAHVRELRRQKAKEEQASAAVQGQTKVNALSNFSGLPSLGAPQSMPPVSMEGPDPTCGEQHGAGTSGPQRTSPGIPTLGVFQGGLQDPGLNSLDAMKGKNVHSGPFDIKQAVNHQSSSHSFALQHPMHPSGSPFGPPGAPKKNYATGTHAPPLGGQQRYSPRPPSTPGNADPSDELDVQLAEARARFEELQARKLAETQTTQKRNGYGVNLK
jgi:hypothetical protein